MSLINEALKKAQSRQTDNTPPVLTTGNSPAPQYQQRDKGPSGWMILFILLFTGVLFAGGALLIAWGLFGIGNKSEGKTDSEPTIKVTETEPSPELDVAPILFNSPEPIAEVEKKEEGVPQKPNDEEPPDLAPKPNPTVADTIPSENTSPETESPNSSAASSLTKRSALPDRDIQDYIRSLEIRGVMSNGQKVLLYDAQTQKSVAYEVGSTINNQLQVFIRRITEDKIYFTDNAGVIYTKRF